MEYQDQQEEDVSFHTPEYVRELESTVDALRASNDLLINELGRIAHALFVEPSMLAVLGKIKELQDKAKANEPTL